MITKPLRNFQNVEPLIFAEGLNSLGVWNCTPTDWQVQISVTPDDAICKTVVVGYSSKVVVVVYMTDPWCGFHNRGNIVEIL